jgi:3-oxoacyl-[acyl-carrier protein] reductase
VRLKNKVAVITGSSRGLGRSIALRFAEEGCSVVVNYLKNHEAARETEMMITGSGAQIMLYSADVSVRQQVRKMFKATVDRFGRIDILVNNAGIGRLTAFEDITDSEWQMIMDINLKGPFICSQEVFPYMKEQQYGRIINIASAAGQYHGPKIVHYAVSKAGLISLTKVIARLGAPHDILVNAVAPGIILTDMTKDELKTPLGNRIVGMSLLKRPGDPSDVANSCLFLASDEQNYITGHVISVSGGGYMG